MRIVFVAPRLNTDGPINQLYDLIHNLMDTGLEMSIITLYSEKQGNTQIGRFEDLGIKVDSLKSEGGMNLLTISRKLHVKLDEIKPDIVHSETLPADLAMSRIHGRQYLWVSTIHGDIYSDYMTRFDHRYAKLFIRMHEKAIAGMDLAAACSESICSIYQEKFGDKILSIQNGIEVPEYRERKEPEIMRFRLENGMAADKKVLIVVGSITERKNSLFIVESLKDHLKDNNWQLVFLGTGNMLESCRKAAEGYDIVFKDKVNNVRDYLYASDVFISASLSEGLPLSVLESGSSGLRMVLSDILQHKEISMYDGDSGIEYFASGNSEDLIRAVKKQLSGNTRSQTVRNYYEEHFSAKKMALKYLEFYKNAEAAR